MKIEVDPDKCIGCYICETVCMMKYEGVFNPRKGRIRLKAGEKSGGIPAKYVPTVCLQCEEPDCVPSCPTEALVRNEDTGIIEVEEELCTGCEACIQACPYDAIFIHPEKTVAIKCEVCSGEPLCTPLCPSGALRLIKYDPMR
ncbi:MAG: 4Fe-4S dicluster domain-containing protein [Candidatus Geothermarchaeales archaeon]